MIKVTKYNDSFKDVLLKGIKEDLSEESFLSLKNSIENIKENEEYLICTDENGEFVGFSKTINRARGFVYLENIYVKKSLRRDKNGSVILVAITTRAVNNLNVAVTCQCEKSNSVAIAFLRARSFILTEEDENMCYFSRNLLPMYKIS